MLLLTYSHTIDGTQLPVGWMPKRGGSAAIQWQRFVPPAAAFRIGTNGAVTALTDAAGLASIAILQGDGWVAASTSPTALREAGGMPIDEASLLDLALTGSFVGSRTAFEHVHRLEAGREARIDAGRLTVRASPSWEPAIPPATAAGMATMLREACASAVAGCESIVLELSGGLDSRVMLACLTPADRRRVQAVTLGPADSPDAVVARRVAATAGVPHRNLDLKELRQLGPHEAHTAARESAARHDFGGNPLALLVIDEADRLMGTAPRLSGQNGELARGFYYAAQPPWPRSTRTLVSMLERWRLTTNDLVDEDLFVPGVLEDAHRSLVDRLTLSFASFPCPWLTATDHLYLRLRMQRWVGSAYSQASHERPVLAPFFDPRFVKWALACPPRRKQGSRITAAALLELDDMLASLPLDDARTPATIAQPNVKSRVRDYHRLLVKLGAKAGQRLSARTRPAALTSDLSGKVLASWRAGPRPLERVASLPWIERTTVESIASGDRPADAPTVGFLLTLESLCEPAGNRKARR